MQSQPNRDKFQELDATAREGREKSGSSSSRYTPDLRTVLEGPLGNAGNATAHKINPQSSSRDAERTDSSVLGPTIWCLSTFWKHRPMLQSCHTHYLSLSWLFQYSESNVIYRFHVQLSTRVSFFSKNQREHCRVSISSSPRPFGDSAGLHTHCSIPLVNSPKTCLPHHQQIVVDQISGVQRL